MKKVAVEPILEADLPEVAAFLHEHLARERSPEAWQAGLRTHWRGERPNYGFMLRDEGRIVGTICAYYADRTVAGKPVRMCNITSWCVLDDYRKLSMKLAMTVVQQPGYHFTDFSPTVVVGGVLRFLKFRPLPEAQVVVFSVPSLLPGGRVITEPAAIERELSGEALQAYRDHAGFPWLRHALVGRPGQWCHVIHKPFRFKGLAAARIIHLGAPAVFRQHLGAWCRHLLLHGVATTHVEQRWLPDRPWHSAVRSGFNAKVHLGDTLADDEIDYLYSETVALDL